MARREKYAKIGGGVGFAAALLFLTLTNIPLLLSISTIVSILLISLFIGIVAAIVGYIIGWVWSKVQKDKIIIELESEEILNESIEGERKLENKKEKTNGNNFLVEQRSEEMQKLQNSK